MRAINPRKFLLLRGMDKHCPVRKLKTASIYIALLLSTVIAIEELAELRAGLAEADIKIAMTSHSNEEMLKIIAGKLEMIEPVGDSMAQVGKVGWTLVERDNTSVSESSAATTAALIPRRVE